MGTKQHRMLEKGKGVFNDQSMWYMIVWMNEWINFSSDPLGCFIKISHNLLHLINKKNIS